MLHVHFLPSTLQQQIRFDSIESIAGVDLFVALRAPDILNSIIKSAFFLALALLRSMAVVCFFTLLIAHPFYLLTSAHSLIILHLPLARTSIFTSQKSLV